METQGRKPKRRKLPLEGKIFLLDLSSKFQQVERDITARIEALGGTIEIFFSKRVTHIITTKQTRPQQQPNSDSSDGTITSSSTSGNGSSTNIASSISSASTSSNEFKPPRLNSNGSTSSSSSTARFTFGIPPSPLSPMNSYVRSLERSFRTNRDRFLQLSSNDDDLNLLNLAVKYNIKVVYLDKIIKFLNNVCDATTWPPLAVPVLNLQNSRNARIDEEELQRQCRERALRYTSQCIYPYILVFDIYNPTSIPILKQFEPNSANPFPSIDFSRNRLPFVPRLPAPVDSAPKQRKQQHQQVRPKGNGVQYFVHTTKPQRPGYCENCKIKYNDYSEHVRGAMHSQFACNNENFKEIDALMAELDEQFFANRRSNNNNDNNNLPKPPSYFQDSTMTTTTNHNNNNNNKKRKLTASPLWNHYPQQNDIHGILFPPLQLQPAFSSNNVKNKARCAGYTRPSFAETDWSRWSPILSEHFRKRARLKGRTWARTAAAQSTLPTPSSATIMTSTT